MTHRIRIRRGDRELELEGDPAFLEAQLDRLAAIAFGQAPASETPAEPARPATSDAPEFPPLSATFTVRKNLSFADFCDLKDPESDVDRFLVLAYYQEKYETRASYTLPDLRELWVAAWPTLPFEETIWQEALERGFVQWQDDGHLTLSFSGQNYVRNGLA